MATVTSAKEPDAREPPAGGSSPANRRRWRPLAWLGSPIAASLGVHVLLLVALTLLVAAPPVVRPAVLAIVAQVADAEADLEPLVIEPLPEQAVERPILAAEAVAVGPVELGDALAVDSIEVVPSDLAAIPPPGDLGAEFGGVGAGMADDGLANAAATFFGMTARGRRFVFVLDNSNSMANGRLETAFAELEKAVDGLGPKQSFYVILFSDTAYRMFHPRPAPTLVPATAENKRRLREWLGTVEMCLKTRGEEAVTAAVAMQPDVISILGDGRFTDRATQLLTAPHDRGIVINTYGMQVDAAGRRDLEAIARANGGSFKPVETSPAAVSLSRSRPINRNKVKGDVWGLELPAGPGR